MNRLLSLPIVQLLLLLLLLSSSSSRGGTFLSLLAAAFYGDDDSCNEFCPLPFLLQTLCGDEQRSSLLLLLRILSTRPSISLQPWSERVLGWTGLEWFFWSLRQQKDRRVSSRSLGQLESFFRW